MSGSKKAAVHAEPTFDDLVAMLEKAKETGIARRDALQAEIEEAATTRAEAIAKAEADYEAAVTSKTEELATVNAQLEKLGIAPPAMATERKAKAPGERAPRGSVMSAVYDLIKADKHEGLTRAMVIKKLGAENDTSAQSSISNALNSLKKSGRIVSDRGYYTVSPEATSVETPVDGD
jgi:hypothetical protein